MSMKAFRLMWIVLAMLVTAAACDEGSDDENGGGKEGEGEDTGTGGAEDDTGTGEEDTGTGEEVIAEFTFDESDEGWEAEQGGWTWNEEDGTWDGVLEYTEANESVFVQALWPNGVDWSAATEVEVTLAVLESADEEGTPIYTGGWQLFTKTGPDWAWDDTWNNLPAHAEFDDYSWNIGARNGQPTSADDTINVDLADMRALGISISSGGDAEAPGTLRVSIDKVVIK